MSPAEPVEVPRGVFLVAMSVPCWEDACMECPGCHCACHDKPPAAVRPVRVHVTVPQQPRCRDCGYLAGSRGCEITCGSRIMRLADRVGRAA